MTTTLHSLGYEVRVAADRQELDAMVAGGWPDLVVLDVVLPDCSGLVRCGELRSAYEIPIVFYCHSRRQEDQALAALLGADDFVMQTVQPAELQARIDTVLERSSHQSLPRSAGRAAPSQFGALTIERSRRQVCVGGQEIPVSDTEFRLLEVLASQPGAVLSRTELAVRVWGRRLPVGKRWIDIHMAHIRAKLNASTVTPPQIVAVHRAGYKLVLPEDSDPR